MCSAKVKNGEISFSWYFLSSALNKFASYIVPVLFIFIVCIKGWNEWDSIDIMVWLILLAATFQLAYGCHISVDLSEMEIVFEYSFYGLVFRKHRECIRKLEIEKSAINKMNLYSFIYSMNTIWAELENGKKIRLYDFFEDEREWERIVAEAQ